MGFSRINSFTQIGDVAGSVNIYQNMIPTEEPAGYGIPIAGKFGNNASIVSVDTTTNLAIISGLSGMTNQSLGRIISISNAAHPGNNTSLIINQIINSTTVRINNFLAFDITASEANNGFLKWQERNTYSLEDDINYIRTDRVKIKGTANYYDELTTYITPDGYLKTSNLFNLAGKGTDGSSYTIDLIQYNLNVSNSNSFITFTKSNSLHHTINSKLGIPLFDDGYYLDDYESCFVEICNSLTGEYFSVPSGPFSGERIFGLTKKGSSVSPNSVEIHFYSYNPGGNFNSNHSYTWNLGNSSINIRYGYHQRLDQLNKSSLRTFPFASSVSNSDGYSSGITDVDHARLRQLIHLADEDGPFEEFASGAYREFLPNNLFPTSMTWYENDSKSKKIVEKIIFRNSNNMPSTITWNVYNTNGVTIIHTVRDTITYENNIFEKSRVREIL
jgi:hypothetical protein